MARLADASTTKTLPTLWVMAAMMGVKSPYRWQQRQMR